MLCSSPLSISSKLTRREQPSLETVTAKLPAGRPVRERATATTSRLPDAAPMADATACELCRERALIPTSQTARPRRRRVGPDAMRSKCSHPTARPQVRATLRRESRYRTSCRVCTADARSSKLSSWQRRASCSALLLLAFGQARSEQCPGATLLCVQEEISRAFQGRKGEREEKDPSEGVGGRGRSGHERARLAATRLRAATAGRLSRALSCLAGRERVSAGPFESSSQQSSLASKLCRYEGGRQGKLLRLRVRASFVDFLIFFRLESRSRPVEPTTRDPLPRPATLGRRRWQPAPAPPERPATRRLPAARASGLCGPSSGSSAEAVRQRLGWEVGR